MHTRRKHVSVRFVASMHVFTSCVHVCAVHESVQTFFASHLPSYELEQIFFCFSHKAIGFAIISTYSCLETSTKFVQKLRELNKDKNLRKHTGS